MESLKLRRLRLCATAVILNLLFIWGNSLLPANISAAFSTFVRNLLAGLFSGSDLESDPSAGHGILRKVAHFLEFCSLGFLLCLLLHLLCKRLSFALLFGALAGGIDECIQLFVPDRGPHIRDVLIDTLGVIAGIGVFIILLAIRKRKKQLILEENNQ